MGQLVTPRAYLIGFTDVYEPGLTRYLVDTDQESFLASYREARAAGLSGGEVLCSFYSKICYKSLVKGKNANVTRVRDVQANLQGTYDAAHGAVFEHCNLNFIVTDCSRIFTHEQVRHRVGVAYSQTSGRYCRLDTIDLVWDPILDPVRDLFVRAVASIETTVYLAECRLGLRKPNPLYPTAPPELYLEHLPVELVTSKHTGAPGASPAADQMKWVPDDTFDFERRKKLTSAIRRIAPNGQSNELGLTLNVRALRHVVQLRTQRHAEREIRLIFGQIYHAVSALFPTVFYGAKTRIVDGLLEVYGMKGNPYDVTAGDPAALEQWTTQALVTELARRESAPPAAAT